MQNDTMEVGDEEPGPSQQVIPENTYQRQDTSKHGYNPDEEQKLWKKSH